MGGARRHPGIRNWSRTWLATAEVSQAHKSASRDECAYRETPFVSPRAVSNRCNTAERTRQQAGRQTVSARERWGVKVLRHQQTTAGGVKLQLITTRRLEAGSRLHHHPPLLVFRAWKWCFCNTCVIFLSAWGLCRFQTFFFFLNIVAACCSAHHFPPLTTDHFCIFPVK